MVQTEKALKKLIKSYADAFDSAQNLIGEHHNSKHLPNNEPGDFCLACLTGFREKYDIAVKNLKKVLEAEKNAKTDKNDKK